MDMTILKPMLGYVSADELLGALAAGRLRQVFEGSTLRLYEGFPGFFAVYGMKNCLVSRCNLGARLPEELRSAMERFINRQIAQRDSNSQYSVLIQPRNFTDAGACIGCWGELNRDAQGARAVYQGRQLRHITNVSWRRPELKLLGIDLERRTAIYEYTGEAHVA